MLRIIVVPKLVELREALHDHIERIRAKTMFYPIHPERRAVVEEPLLTENKAERDESPEAQPEPHTFPVRD
jgi:hypothetical protein